MRIAGNGQRYFYGSWFLTQANTAVPALSITGTQGSGAAVVSNSQNLAPTGYTSFRLYNDQGSALRALEIDYSGSAYASGLIINGPTGESAALKTTGPYPLSLGTNNTEVMRLSSVGTVNFTPNAGQPAITVSTVNASTQAIFSSSGAPSIMNFTSNVSNVAWIGVTNVGATLMSDSVAGDMVTLAQSGSWRVSTGGTTGLQLNSSNQVRANEPLNSINALKNVATYETGSFTGTLTGCTTSPTTTFNWSRNGNAVTIDCAVGLIATSNTTACTITGVPAALNPVRAVGALVFIQNNTTVEVGQAVVGGGVIVLSRAGGITFTASGTKGLQGNASFTYNLT